MQYVSDIIGNIADGKTGAEVFIPTSSLATYGAAAITVVIPGATLGKAFIRSLVTESILWLDNSLQGQSDLNDVKMSVNNVILNTIIDFGTGYLLDNTFGTMGTSDISTTATKMLQKGTMTTLEEAYKCMHSSNTVGRFVGTVFTKIYEIAVNYYQSAFEDTGG